MTDQELHDNLVMALEMNERTKEAILLSEITGEIDTNLLVKNALTQGLVKGVFCERYGWNILTFDGMLEFMKEKLRD